MERINQGHINKPVEPGSGERALESLQADGQKVLDKLRREAEAAQKDGRMDQAFALMERHNKAKELLKEKKGDIIRADTRN